MPDHGHTRIATDLITRLRAEAETGKTKRSVGTQGGERVIVHATGTARLLDYAADQIEDMLSLLTSKSRRRPPVVEPVIVVCTRDPDSSNEYQVFGAPEPLIVDIDLGYMNLDDPIEFAEWAASHTESAAGIPAGRVGDQARRCILSTIETEREHHGHPEVA